VQEPPLVLDRPDDVARFRAALDEAGYTAEHIRSALGVEASRPVRAADLPVQRRRLRDETPFAALVRLFWLGDAIGPDEARPALGTLDVEQAEALGLVEETAAGVRARVRLSPFDPLVLACDRNDEGAAAFVPGLHPPSVTLANLTVRTAVESALDVAAGSGAQALLAAAHSERVVATDINARALHFLAFNAQLNGVDNVECREGSLFEPVAGERFDLLTCNPPYVVSPETRFLFRDSGLEGDAISREAVRQAPAFLAEGGFAHVLVSWVRRSGEDWRTPVGPWVEDSGCDAWVLHSGSEDPLTAAATWNRPLQLEEPEAFERTLDAWLAYYERLGVESIAYGAVILRRREGGRNWLRFDDLLSSPIGSSSDLVLRVFANQDFLEALADEEALLAQAFRLVERHRIEQAVRLRDEGYEVGSTVLVLEEGLEFRGPVDGLVLDVLAGCDGTRPLGRLCEEAAEGHGLDAGEARAELAEVVRRLLELGFLTRGR
jgi:hypothetical protein